MSINNQLLFGLLALQCGFVNKDQLVSAFAIWTSSKNRPIDAILAEQQFLQPQHANLLHELAEVIIRQHGGDVEQSIAALVQDKNFKRDLNTLGDPDLCQSLLKVPDLSPNYSTIQVPNVPAPARGDSRFSVVRQHAKGGLGEVYVAIDQELNREVALKEIQSKYADHAESRNRFRLEAEITGNLEHPGIVPVYGLGKYIDGRPYYAMRFVRGSSLHDAIEDHHRKFKNRLNRRNAVLDMRKLLRRFVDICNAIDYAHSRGVLHRDLKPANVILGKFGETLVIDWGLAKANGRSEILILPSQEHKASTESVPTPTQMGHVLGTPAYMSPEQASGLVDQLGAPTDVFGLGAILFQLLAGSPPVPGADLNEVLKNAERGVTRDIRDGWPRIPKALAAIAKKAIHADIKARYDSALSLADDIENWLADEPVSAHRDSIFAKSARFIRKNQMLAASAIIVLLGGLLLSMLQIRNYYRFKIVESESAYNEFKANTAEREARVQKLSAELNSVKEAAAKRTPGWTWSNEAQLNQLSLDNDLHFARMVRQEKLRCILNPDFQLKPFGKQPVSNDETLFVSEYAFSPNGKFIALGEWKSSSLNVRIRVVDAVSFETLHRFSYFPSMINAFANLDPDGVSSLCFSSDSSQLYVGTRSGEIYLFDLKSHKSIGNWKAHSNRVDDMIISSDDRYLITASRDQSVKWWNAATRKQERKETVNCRELHPLNDKCFCSSDGIRLYPMDPSGGGANTIANFGKDLGKVTAIGEQGVLSANAEELSLFDLSGRRVRTMRPKFPLSGIDGISVGNFGRYAIVYSFKRCDVWELPSGNFIGSIEGTEIYSAVADPLRPRFFIGGEKEVRCFELRQSDGWQMLPIQASNFLACKPGGDGKTIVSVRASESNDEQKLIQRWDVASNICTGLLKIDMQEPIEFALGSAGSEIIAWIANEQKLLGISFEHNLRRDAVKCGKEEIRHVCRSADDRRVWMTQQAKQGIVHEKLRAWDVVAFEKDTGKEVFRWTNQIQQAAQMRSDFSGLLHGTKMVFAGTRNELLSLSLLSSEQFRKVYSSKARLNRIAFIQDESFVVVGTLSGEITIVDSKSGQHFSAEPNEQHTGAVTAIAEMDKKRIVSGDQTGDMIVWQVENGIPKSIASIALPGPIDSIVVLPACNKLAILLKGESTIRLLDTSLLSGDGVRLINSSSEN
ncbi:MAG: serine/threonine-protein kinase [Pirellula sp.]